MKRPKPNRLVASLQAHYGDLVRHLTRKTGDPERAADVAQDTFIRLTLNAPDEARIANPRAYVYRAAGNLAIDYARQDRRQATWLSGEEPDFSILDPSPDAERVAIGRDTLARLEHALDDLPPNARLALLMFRVDELSHREIAERLGVSTSMVAKYISQALRHCRDRLWQLD